MRTILEIIKEEENTLNNLVEHEYIRKIKEYDNNKNNLEQQILDLKYTLVKSENEIKDIHDSHSKSIKYKNSQSTRKFIIWASPFILFIILVNFLGIFWALLITILIWLFIIFIITAVVFPKNVILDEKSTKESLNKNLYELEKLKIIIKQVPIQIASLETKLKDLRLKPIRREIIKKEILSNYKEIKNKKNYKWDRKNLNVEVFRNGDLIPHCKTNEEWVQAGKEEKPAWCYYNNNPANGSIYGKLYNWYAVNDPRGLAPIGWHIPSDAEWTELEIYLSDNGYNFDSTLGGVRGKIAKAMATSSGWKNHSKTGAIGNSDFLEYQNKSGFGAKPGGCRIYDGSFCGMGEYGDWWCASESSSDEAWKRSMASYSIDVYRSSTGKALGFSVRCVRD